METFILGFAVTVLAILGMAVGVLFGRPPLREGGCGDVKNIEGCGCCRHAIGASSSRVRNGGILS